MREYKQEKVNWFDESPLNLPVTQIKVSLSLSLSQILVFFFQAKQNVDVIYLYIYPKITEPCYHSGRRIDGARARFADASSNEKLTRLSLTHE